MTPSLEQEAWIVRALRNPALFCGITTAEIRKQRLRSYLVDNNLADKRAGHRNGQPESWSEVFERLFLEPL